MFCNVSFGGIVGDILKKFEKTPPACMEGDCENGYGTYEHEDGNKYVGVFKDGKRDGQGTYTQANGDKYVGEYKDDKLDGEGTLTFANGDKYVGEFKDGNYHGQGTFTWTDGAIEKGIWENNELVEPN